VRLLFGAQPHDAGQVRPGAHVRGRGRQRGGLRAACSSQLGGQGEQRGRRG
jgi:hypothetical protein